MRAYYDHGPLLTLAKHVAVTGWLSELTRAVSYRAAALLGLPFSELDRLVEHETGTDLGKLVLTEGEQAYRAVESRCLERAVRGDPPAILALGDGALLDATNLERVATNCRLVVLKLDLSSLFWRVKTSCRQRESEYWHPLFAGVPDFVDDLRPFFLRRKASFAAADKTLDVRGLSPTEASRRLQRWIESDGSSQAVADQREPMTEA